LPKVGSDIETFGYRWQVKDEVYIRVIGESGVGNSQQKIEMKTAVELAIGLVGLFWVSSAVI
jgi:hypothetical protein